MAQFFEFKAERGNTGALISYTTSAAIMLANDVGREARFGTTSKGEPVDLKTMTARRGRAFLKRRGRKSETRFGDPCDLSRPESLAMIRDR